MKIIDFDTIKSLNITPEMCYEWVSDMIFHKQESVLPAKIHMAMPNNEFCNVMPSIIPRCNGEKYAGLKIVTRYPQREPALDSKILIFNADSGKFLALVDGDWITAMRTGAVAVHSVKLLAKKDFSVIGLVGLGNTARATMFELAAMFPDRVFEIKLLRYKDQADSFMKRFSDYSNFHFTVLDEPRDIVKGSDVVISCATYLEKDICSDDCFDEGVLVVPVHTRGFTNCDLFFDKVFADDTGHVKDFKYFDRFKYFAEVCDVVNGKVAGRASDKERILVYNIGISIHDVSFAGHIYQMLREKPEVFDNLTDANLHDPTEKFWI